MSFEGIQAVLFDMDGTLVDSEHLTDQAVEALLAARGLPSEGLDFRPYHGTTWEAVEADLWQRYPALRAQPLAAWLAAWFDGQFRRVLPPVIPDADWALQAARERVPTAIVSSSTRDCVQILAQHLLERFGVTVDTCVCDRDYERSKPAPDGFRTAAERLAVEPCRCLVFEDSVAGLQAARAASMRCIGIASDRSLRPALESLAETVIDDYRALPRDFFAHFGPMRDRQHP